MPEENPENQVKKERLGKAGLGPMVGAPITPMKEPPPPAPKEEKAAEGAPAEAPPEEGEEPTEEPSMRQRQQQVNQRVGLQGQKLPKPRLAEGRQKSPAPLAPVAGAAKKAAAKWLLPVGVGSGVAGGILGYFLT